MLTLGITTPILDLLEYIIKTTLTLLKQFKYPIVLELNLPPPALRDIVMHDHKS